MQREISGQQDEQKRLTEETGLAYQRYLELNNRLEQQKVTTDHTARASPSEQREEGREDRNNSQGRGLASDYNRPMGAGRDDRNLGHPRREVPVERRSSTNNEYIPGEEYRRNSDPGRMIAVNSPIRPPPKFTPELYARWKEELSFWREIHSFASDSNLIAEMALSSADALRTVLTTFLRNTKDNKGERTFEKLLSILDAEFQKDSEERDLAKLASFNSFPRSAQEPVRIFWIRFQEMIDECRSCGLELSEKMIYLRGLQALNVSEMQRMSILVAMTYSQNTSCRKVLKMVSTRLMTPMSSNNAESEHVYYEAQWIDQEDGEPPVYLAKAKAKNRPGLEQSSIRVSAQQMGFPNMAGGKKEGVFGKGKGKMKRYRCSSTDHIARECRLPYVKGPVFAPKPEKGKKGGKRIYLNEGIDIIETLEGNAEMTETLDLGVEGEEIATGETGEDGSIDNREDIWLSQWWDDGTYLMKNTENKKGEKIPGRYLPEPIVRIRDRYQIMSAIVDSGASWSVVVKKWL